jgi:hypothetical protein
MICLKSQNLERRIHGIKVIDELIKEQKYTSIQSQTLTPEQLI